MKYNWGIYSLLDDVVQLKDMLNKTTNIKERKKILMAIGKINSSIVEQNFENRDFNSSEYNVDENYSLFLDKYNDYMIYQDLIDDFYSANLNSLLYFEPFDEYYLNKRIGLEEYQTSIYDFYKSIGGYFFSTFYKIYENRYSCYKIHKPDEYYDDTCGSTILIPYLNKAYIDQVYNEENPTCRQIMTGVHEYGHAIAGVMNNSRYGDSIYLNEIESFFFELLSYDFYSEYFNTNSFYKEAYSNMLDYKTECSGVKDFEKYLNEYIQLSYKGKLLCDLDESDRKSFEYFCNSIDLSSTYKYLISYIVAVNLYLLYRKDHEKALWALNLIISTTRDKEYDTICRNMDESSHILEYKKILDKKI